MFDTNYDFHILAAVAFAAVVAVVADVRVVVVAVNCFWNL